MSKSHSCQIKLEPILTGITPPRIIKTAILPGERAESLFIATPDGEISKIESAHTKFNRGSSDWYLEDFLDISDLTMKDGLHGFEFHPDFNENGRFYLHYSVRDSESISPNCSLPDPSDPFSLQQDWIDRSLYHHYDTIEEWILPETGIPICIRTLLNIKWPFSNHNGKNTLGWNNNCLILLTGDGGSFYDPFNQAQNNMSLLGKVIAINVDYRPWKFMKDPVPASNLEELDPIRRESLRIIAKGLCNPSGFEVDGPIKYVTDMGQGEVEKIMAFSRWRKNFGWRAWDGVRPTRGPQGDVLYHGESLDLSDYHRPTAFYSHQEVRRELISMVPPEGVIGGCVYHGDKILDLNDRYIFADAGGSIFSIRCIREEDNNNEPQIPRLHRINEDDFNITALGGNRRRTRIFVGGYNNGVGGLYELVS